MAENLVIRLTEHDTDTVEWMLTDDSGARQGAPVRGTLRAAADAAGGRQISVLLPASEILLTSADIPAKGARLLQALPFALEEQLADDVDKLHFAAGTRRSSGRTPVAVIRRDQLQDFLDKLDEAGIKPSGIYAETQGLARIPGTISLLIDGDNLLLNDGADVELAMQQISPGDALVAIGALDDHAVGAESDDDTEGTPLPSHVLVYLNEADNERYNHDWLALRNELDSLETRLLPDGALPRLAATVASGKAINLLQGDFAVKSEGNPSLKPWRLVAALLLATLVVSIVQKATDYYSLQRELNRAQVQLEQQWQKTLPWIKPVPDNPGSRLSAELRRMGQAQAGEQDAQLLKALAALSTALKVSPDSKIEDISFSSGVTAIQLLVPNTDQLDKIQSGVQASPELDALILRAEKNNDGDGMLSRLQIKASAK